jgi:hypothetical protein
MRVISQSPDPWAGMHTRTDRKGKSGAIDLKALLGCDTGEAAAFHDLREDRMLSNWSIGLSDHCVTSNSIFDSSDIIQRHAGSTLLRRKVHARLQRLRPRTPYPGPQICKGNLCLR